MHEDYRDTELTVTHRQAYARHRGVGISMPGLPAWMPAALGVDGISAVNFAPARGAAELRVEIGGPWLPLTSAQQAVIAVWVRRAVEAVHAASAEAAPAC